MSGRTLVIRKGEAGTVFISTSQGDSQSTVAITDPSTQMEIVRTIECDGPREFAIGY